MYRVEFAHDGSNSRSRWRQIGAGLPAVPANLGTRPLRPSARLHDAVVAQARRIRARTDAGSRLSLPGLLSSESKPERRACFIDLSQRLAVLPSCWP
jgi:hypothetical protein